MTSFLETLQKKPENIKKRIALGTAGVIVLTMFIVWLSFFRPWAPAASDAQAVSPFAGLMSFLKDAWGAAPFNTQQTYRTATSS